MQTNFQPVLVETGLKTKLRVLYISVYYFKVHSVYTILRDGSFNWMLEYEVYLER